MGCGVFTMPDADTVIIDHTAVYGDWDQTQPYGYQYLEDEMDVIVYYNAFVAEVRHELPASWSAVEHRWRDRDSKVIAENRFYQLCLTDWEDDFYLSVALQRGFNTASGYHPLAQYHQSRVSGTLFIRLAERYPLRVRTSGYTTASYDPRV